MTRKKISDESFEADAAANLRDDEEIVLSDVRTIRKNKRKPPEPITVELDDGDLEDAEIVNDNPYPIGTVGHRAFGEDGDANAITECNILVVRKPDGAGDNFLKPCKSRMSEPPIRNVELTATESEIEEIVRANCGGGHYYLQTQFGNRHGRGWTVSLSDPPDAIAKAKAEQTASATPAAATAAEPPRDPLDSMLDNLTKMKLLRDALFGDERDRLERQIEELKREIENRPTPEPAAPLPENLQILEKALATSNPNLQEKLLEYAFPSDSGSHWIPETLKTIFEHKDEIGGILAGLLGTARPPQPSNIDSILRGTPPSALPPPAVTQSQFHRKTVPPAENTEAAEPAEDKAKDE